MGPGDALAPADLLQGLVEGRATLGIVARVVALLGGGRRAVEEAGGELDALGADDDAVPALAPVGGAGVGDAQQGGLGGGDEALRAGEPEGGDVAGGELTGGGGVGEELLGAGGGAGADGREQQGRGGDPGEEERAGLRCRHLDLTATAAAPAALDAGRSIVGSRAPVQPASAGRRCAARRCGTTVARSSNDHGARA
ncbi:MAG: hypothetical protein CVU56_18165 [Deltaproteobacteria bacterium HGW-Deltaproteobacteria-14]|nr:MAG: hypothetical protein CVU56_18165 [Deltaproteobacteria bacterium HGW-Deltaproteobacteria-14]